MSGQAHNSLVFSLLYVFTFSSSSCVLSPVFSSFCSVVECVSSDSQDVTNERALLIAPPAKQNLGWKTQPGFLLKGRRPGVTSGLASHKFIDLRISEWTFQEFSTQIDHPSNNRIFNRSTRLFSMLKWYTIGKDLVLFPPFQVTLFYFFRRFKSVKLQAFLNTARNIFTVRLLKPGPPRQWKPIRWQNWNNRFQHFQIAPIKCSVQNNEISTCCLWCLRD